MSTTFNRIFKLLYLFSLLSLFLLLMASLFKKSLLENIHVDSFPEPVVQLLNNNTMPSDLGVVFVLLTMTIIKKHGADVREWLHEGGLKDTFAYVFVNGGNVFVNYFNFILKEMSLPFRIPNINMFGLGPRADELKQQATDAAIRAINDSLTTSRVLHEQIESRAGSVGLRTPFRAIRDLLDQQGQQIQNAAIEFRRLHPPIEPDNNDNN